jgi:hypothetical protein
MSLNERDLYILSSKTKRILVLNTTEAHMAELKVTAERVKEAAASCQDADRVLRKLFPEAFAPEPVLVVTRSDGALRVDGELLMARNSGNFAGRAIYLDGSHRWDIVKDNQGATCLVAYRQ